jgi:putative copper resistance protein D
MRTLYLLSVWLHILAAMIWLGGMIFLVLVLVPVTRRPEYRGLAGGLIHWTGVRFRWVGWICLALLALSGLVNLAARGVTWADAWSGQLWQTSVGRALGIKLILVAVILILSALHDFAIGPRATAIWQANPGSPEALRLRRQATWIARINLLLALLVLVFAVILVRGWPG